MPRLSPSSRRSAILEALQALDTLSPSPGTGAAVALGLWQTALRSELQQLVSHFTTVQKAEPVVVLTEYDADSDSRQMLIGTEGVHIHPGVTVAASALGGSGVVWSGTCAAANAGTVLIAVEEDAVITVHAALRDPQFGVVAVELLKGVSTAGAAALDEVTDFVLMLFVLYGRYVQQRHGAYYANLPSDEEGHSLLLAPPEVVEFLDVPAVTQSLDESVARLFALFQTLTREMCPKVGHKHQTKNTVLAVPCCPCSLYVYLG